MSHSNRPLPGAALWGVLIGFGLAIAIAACASGGSSRQAISAGPESSMVRAPLSPDKQEILDRWNEIKNWRIERKMSPDPIIDLKRPPPDIMQNSVDKIRRCPVEEDPPKTEECTEVCSLKDDICDHADRICEIADKLEDDAWAREKCTSAKASCKEATEKCCGCLADEKPGAASPRGGETGGGVP